ncbi:hypothetical protein [Paraburkholderia terrae]
MSDIQKYTTLSQPESRLVTGRQAYFLDVLGAANASQLSVVAFEAVERIGEPYRITLTLTHPDQLARSDYLGKDATFSIVPADAYRANTFGTGLRSENQSLRAVSWC